MKSLPREADPEVKIPIAIVTTVFPGASPADVETLVTDEIEAELQNLEDIKLISSSSRNSISSITVEFDAKADLEDSFRSLRDKVLDVSDLPDDAKKPIVTEVRADDFPIISFSLVGDLTDQQLKTLAEIIEDELEKISGVSDVVILGARDREFQVIIRRGALEQYNISIGALIGAIAQSNMDAPLGNITIENIDYSLRTIAKFKNIDDLKDVVVSTADGLPILLEDVADVKDTFTDQSSKSRISVEGKTAVNSVSLDVSKKNWWKHFRHRGQIKRKN